MMGREGRFTSKRSRRRNRTRRHLTETLEQRTLLAAQSLVAYFDFNDPSDLSSHVGTADINLGSASITDPGYGYQQATSDRALRTSGGHATLSTTDFLNSAATDDKLTISMWQQFVGNTLSGCHRVKWCHPLFVDGSNGATHLLLTRKRQLATFFSGGLDDAEAVAW